MGLSVLIVTRNRPELLRRCVRSLLRAASEASGDIELLIDVNGSDARSQAALVELQRQARDAGIVLEHRVEATPLSPAGARNRALARARQPWVFFADDDIYVPVSIFRDFRKLLARFPQAIALGGPNLTPPGSTVFQRASGLALASKLATWQSVPRYRAMGAPRPCGQESLILCNLFVRADSLGFEPFRDTLACGEENWLIRRLSRGESGRVIYAPELLVWHERRNSLGGFARQIFWYGCGRGQNLRLSLGERSLEGRRYLIPSLCVIYTLVAALYAMGERALPTGMGLPFFFYAALCAATLLWAISARDAEEDVITRALSALLIPVIHAFYGVGVLFGLARRS